MSYQINEQNYCVKRQKLVEVLVDKKKRMQDDAVGKKIITWRAVIKYEYV